MDIHDGNTFYKDGKYYYFGASYGTCKEPAGPTGCAGKITNKIQKNYFLISFLCLL
jgi:hypothetical protein